MISLLSTNSILLLSLWYIPVTPFHHYPSTKPHFFLSRDSTGAERERQKDAFSLPAITSSAHLHARWLSHSLLPIPPSLSNVRLQQLLCVPSKLLGGKLPALQKDLCKENTGQDAGYSHCPSQPRCTIPANSSDPPDPGWAGTPQRDQLEALRGEVRTLPPASWRPGSCSRSSPRARSPGAP